MSPQDITKSPLDPYKINESQYSLSSIVVIVLLMVLLMLILFLTLILSFKLYFRHLN
ncbi:unnamed protein product [Acanthoscelides obtectus]|nr:unnamed protein product [Acanthoscelides obtectus]CAK1667101.1 hypothetical protein AOBTE_LOCUS25684 [Acanthoscelides obtectus]